MFDRNHVSSKIIIGPANQLNKLLKNGTTYEDRRDFYCARNYRALAKIGLDLYESAPVERMLKLV